MPWRLIYIHIAIYSNFNDFSKVLHTKHHAQKPNKVSDEHYVIQIRILPKSKADALNDALKAEKTNLN